MLSSFQACILLIMGLPLWPLVYMLYRDRMISYSNLNGELIYRFNRANLKPRGLGPPLDHWFFGNLLSMINLDRYSTGEQQMIWFREYGSVLRYTSIFRRPEVMLADLKGIEYVYRHPDEFDLLDATQEQMRSMTGENVITATGEHHRRLRRIMIPFFGSKTSNYSHQVFVIAASAFVERLVPMIGLELDTGVEIDAFDWCNRLTMDIIGLAGFGYKFGALSGERSELLEAWMEMMNGFGDRSFLALLMFVGVTGTRLSFVG